MAKAVLAVLVGSSLLVAGCSQLNFLDSHSQKVSASERLAVLRRAQLWTPTNVADMDIVRGPAGKGFAPGETIACDYVDVKYSGNTPKFGCAREGEDVMKVRYGRDNGEVFAGVAATRLLWALGFGADSLYPVHIVCRGCPGKMAAEGTPVSGAIEFDVAAVERKFRGHDIEAHDMAPGWSWDELDLVDTAEGGAPEDQRDALRLLAVFLQHTDSKSEQQRLVCRDGFDAALGSFACADPFMMIHDLGQTFGRANLFGRQSLASVNYNSWSTTPIWKDRARCVGNLAPSEWGTLTDPVISEAGRRFLAGLLTQLTSDQIRNLFAVARFPDKLRSTASVEEWAAAFEHKRDEITSTHCR